MSANRRLRKMAVRTNDSRAGSVNRRVPRVGCRVQKAGIRCQQFCPSTESALLCGPRNHPPVANFVSDRTTRLFALVLERRDLAGMFPKLNVMAIHKRLCPLYSLFVAITTDGDRFEKLAVSPDDVSAVICHVMHPCVWAGAQHSLSPMVAHGG